MNVRVCIFLHVPYGCIVSIYGVAFVLLDLLQLAVREPRRAGQVTLKPAFILSITTDNILIHLFFMKSSIHETAQELIKRKEYPEVIVEALQLIIDGQMNSLALDKLLATKGIRRITDIKEKTLDVLLDYADMILEDDSISQEELTNLKMLKIFFRIQEGDFQKNNKFKRVESIIICQLEKLYADNILEYQEELHQSDLQGVFGLGHDEYMRIVNKVANEHMEK